MVVVKTDVITLPEDALKFQILHHHGKRKTIAQQQLLFRCMTCGEENGRSLVFLDLSAAFDMLDHGVVKENRNREVQRQSEYMIS